MIKTKSYEHPKIHIFTRVFFLKKKHFQKNVKSGNQSTTCFCFPAFFLLFLAGEGDEWSNAPRYM